jgi:Rps23 Pro-64 3,4-dihydroxylase Tpa1-like proline 4-hydroxylase
MSQHLQDPPVKGSERLDRRVIRRVLDSMQRVHIPAFFEAAAAARIYQCLTTETPWQLSLNAGERHIDLTRAQFESLTEEERTRLLDSVNRSAQTGFQYIFENFPIYDLYVKGEFRDHYLMRVYEYLNSPDFLGFAREVTGLADIALADAQATAYRPGHFLTTHDDLVEGKHRLAAYVLSFTPHWRADWGGILQFIDADGHIAEGFMPTFNALNLFRVPQRHSVSYVTPAGNAGRYSITGWLRSA